MFVLFLLSFAQSLFLTYCKITLIANQDQVYFASQFLKVYTIPLSVDEFLFFDSIFISDGIMVVQFRKYTALEV